MSEAERWAANQKWLGEAIARGDKIVVATPKSEIRPETPHTKEIKYLTEEKGYKWNEEGTALIVPQSLIRLGVNGHA